VAESERWKELERLLDRALDLAPGDPAAFLEQVCPGDPELRAEVERRASTWACTRLCVNWAGAAWWPSG